MKQILNECQEIIRHYKLEEEALGHTLWRIGFGRVMDLSQTDCVVVTLVMMEERGFA